MGTHAAETILVARYKACQGIHSLAGLVESLRDRQARIVDYEAGTDMGMAVVERAVVADETAELEFESLAGWIRSVRRTVLTESLDCE